MKPICIVALVTDGNSDLIECPSGRSCARASRTLPWRCRSSASRARTPHRCPRVHSASPRARRPVRLSCGAHRPRVVRTLPSSPSSTLAAIETTATTAIYHCWVVLSLKNAGICCNPPLRLLKSYALLLPWMHAVAGTVSAVCLSDCHFLEEK